MKGSVKSFTPRHYGFITVGDQDYKFTYKDWILQTPPTKGIKVAFDARKTEKGLQAINIRILKGEEDGK